MQSLSPPRQLHLLVVEDDPDLLELLLLLFKSQGCSVVLSRDVSSAKATLLSDSFDGIVCDWMLPDGTGGDVYEFMRTVQPDTPFQILSVIESDQPVAIDFVKRTGAIWNSKPTHQSQIKRILGSLKRGQEDD